MEAIDRNYTEPTNDYDKSAAIHLAALTEYWSANEIRNSVADQELMHINKRHGSRLLKEIELFEKTVLDNFSIFISPGKR